MREKTLVSYLIALYNKEHYVERAIASILEDKGDSYDVEVCIVDDGSTDRSAEVVLSRFGSDKRVKLRRFQENRGKNAAYNAAYLLSRGDFMAVLGADDEVVPGRTSLLLNRAIREGAAVYGGRIERNLLTGESRRRVPPQSVTFEENIIKNRLSGGCFIAPRALFDLAMPIPEHLKFEDWWIAFHLLRVGRVKTIQDPVLIYNLGIGNDCGNFEVDYETVRRDYLRHDEYLACFAPFVGVGAPARALRRALALRRAFFGERFWLDVFKRPYNKSSVNLFFLNIFGGRNSIAISNKIKRLSVR